MAEVAAFAARLAERAFQFERPVLFRYGGSCCNIHLTLHHDLMMWINTVLVPFWGTLGAPPNLEPVLVGIGMFTGVQDFHPWPYHEARVFFRGSCTWTSATYKKSLVSSLRSLLLDLIPKLSLGRCSEDWHLARNQRTQRDAKGIQSFVEAHLGLMGAGTLLKDLK